MRARSIRSGCSSSQIRYAATATAAVPGVFRSYRGLSRSGAYGRALRGAPRRRSGGAGGACRASPGSRTGWRTGGLQPWATAPHVGRAPGENRPEQAADDFHAARLRHSRFGCEAHGPGGTLAMRCRQSQLCVDGPVPILWETPEASIPPAGNGRGQGTGAGSGRTSSSSQCSSWPRHATQRAFRLRMAAPR